jgi:hypothetical protein
MHRKPTQEELANKFDHHVPFGDQGERYSRVRAVLKEACLRCVHMTPCSPEQTRAVNAMHEAMMLFNSAIALNEREALPPPSSRERA